MAATVAWADRPRVSSSRSTLQDSVTHDDEDNQNQITKNRHAIKVDSKTHDMFKELMKKTEFSNESAFLNFLMTSALAKIHDLQCVASTAGSAEGSRALLQAESERIGISVDKIITLEVPQDMTNISSTQILQQFECALAKSNDPVQQVRANDEEHEAESTSVTSPRGSIAPHPVIPAINQSTEERSYLVSGQQNQHVCIRCGRDRMTSKELEDHSKHCNILDKYKRMRKVSVPRFIHCTQCGMRFENTSEYKKHYTQYHTNHPALYTCEFCNKKQAFTDKRHLHKHKKTEPVCQECRRRYVSVEIRNLHAKNMNHDQEKRQQVRSAKASGRNNPNAPTVSPALKAVKEAPPDSLPTGYSFMSVKLNPLYKLSGMDDRLVVVPETANRHGYALRAEYLNPPYPVPPIETQANSDSEEDN